MSDRPTGSPLHRLRRYRPRKRHRPRYTGPSFNRMIPNLMTMLGLCAGLTSMRFALEGRFGAAAVAIVVAALIDGLDGRLARLLKATSRFGAEFDSLSDFLCFGVAPPFVLYMWSLQRGGAIGYAPCLMLTVLPRLVASFKLPIIRWPHYFQNMLFIITYPNQIGPLAQASTSNQK